MARTTHTYAVRLAVEQGGRVKAELVSVGETGERSLKRIESAGDRASRGLSRLTDRMRFLRLGVRSLGGALVGAATAGGLVALVKRSIDAADRIGKAADSIGIATDALQEYRFAANLAGIEQATLDNALQAFSKRLGELRAGTGALTTFLNKYDRELLANLRTSKSTAEALDLLFAAMARMTRQSDRAALGAAAFSRSAGVQMTNLVREGADALEAMRRRAHELGIVLEEDLIRNAEKAKDDLTVLETVIGTKVTAAVLELAPQISDLATRFADGLPRLLEWIEAFGRLVGLIEPSKRERLAEIGREIADINDKLASPFYRLLEFDIFGREGPLKKRLRELEAERARLERELGSGRKEPAGPEPGRPQVEPDTPLPDPKAAEDRAREIARIERDLQRQLFTLTHEGAARIEAEYARLAERIRSLAAPGGQDAARIEALLARAAAVRDAKLARLRRQEEEAARRRAEANRKVIEELRAEQDALAMTDRERFIAQALRRLSAEATEAERRKVRELAGALYDERQAREAARRAADERRRLLEEGRALTERLRTAEEAYAAELSRLNTLLRAGAIDQETYARAAEEAYGRMLAASEDWSAGVRRALKNYADEAAQAARQFEQATTRALKAGEDAFVQWATTGKVSASDLFNTIAEEALRAAYRMAVVKPLGGIFESVLGSLGSAIFGGLAGGEAAAPVGDFPVETGPVMVAHRGGVIGVDRMERRRVAPVLFAEAPRFHAGGLVPGEVPIIARRGEGVFTPGQMRALGLAQRPEVKVAVNVRNNAAGTEATARWRRDAAGNVGVDILVEQVEGRLARNIGRGEGLAPALERRYGLNPAAGSFR